MFDWVLIAPLSTYASTRKHFHDTEKNAYELRCIYRKMQHYYIAFPWIFFRKNHNNRFLYILSLENNLFIVSSDFKFSIFPKFTFSSLSRT